jgi:transposase InsO family protein
MPAVQQRSFGTLLKRCREAGIRCSMGSVGDGYNNAMEESFFATLECKLLAQHTSRTHTQVRTSLFEYLEGPSEAMVCLGKQESA